jgi:hypothetical protein
MARTDFARNSRFHRLRPVSQQQEDRQPEGIQRRPLARAEVGAGYLIARPKLQFPLFDPIRSAGFGRLVA